MLSEIRFGTFLISPTRLNTELGRKAVRIAKAIKNDRAFSATETWAQVAARRLRETAPAELMPFLGPDTVLVPVPRSGLWRQGEHWPARRICECLIGEGFGKEVRTLLRRETPLRSSSQAGIGNRPPFREKYESIRARASVPRPTSITVVDDLLTKGHEMFAGAARLAEVYPDVPIRGFAVALTKGFLDKPEEFTSIRDPYVGTLKRDTRDQWKVSRDPW